MTLLSYDLHCVRNKLCSIFPMPLWAELQATKEVRRHTCARSHTCVMHVPCTLAWRNTPDRPENCTGEETVDRNDHTQGVSTHRLGAAPWQSWVLARRVVKLLPYLPLEFNTIQKLRHYAMYITSLISSFHSSFCSALPSRIFLFGRGHWLSSEVLWQVSDVAE